MVGVTVGLVDCGLEIYMCFWYIMEVEGMDPMSLDEIDPSIDPSWPISLDVYNAIFEDSADTFFDILTYPLNDMPIDLDSTQTGDVESVSQPIMAVQRSEGIDVKSCEIVEDQPDEKLPTAGTESKMIVDIPNVPVDLQSSFVDSTAHPQVTVSEHTDEKSEDVNSTSISPDNALPHTSQ